MPEAAVGNRERRDIDPKAVALTGVGLVGFVALALIVLGLLFGRPPSPLPFNTATGLDATKQPVLQTDPKDDRVAYDAEKQAELNGLGWVNQSAGIAHIPIADAMQIIAQKGIPGFGTGASASAAGATVSQGECAVLEQDVPRAPQAANCPPLQSGSPPASGAGGGT